MSFRIICLHGPPQAGEYAWADAIVHPGMTVTELHEVAKRYAWQRPLKIILEPGGVTEGWSEHPLSWITLQSLLREECAVPDEEYSVGELQSLPIVPAAPSSDQLPTLFGFPVRESAEMPSGSIVFGLL